MCCSASLALTDFVNSNRRNVSTPNDEQKTLPFGIPEGLRLIEFDKPWFFTWLRITTKTRLSNWDTHSGTSYCNWNSTHDIFPDFPGLRGINPSPTDHLGGQKNKFDLSG